MPAEVLILDAGLAVACLGTRRRGLVAFLSGLALAGLAALMPVPPRRLSGPTMGIDAVVPEYQFGEAHEILVRAPRDRVWRATLDVTADEIRLFRTLTWLRSPRGTVDHEPPAIDRSRHHARGPEAVADPGAPDYLQRARVDLHDLADVHRRRVCVSVVGGKADPLGP